MRAEGVSRDQLLFYCDVTTAAASEVASGSAGWKLHHQVRVVAGKHLQVGTRHRRIRQNL